MSEKREFSPTRAQALAESFSGADLLVSAGAGSGKTATLTRRIVNKLIAGEDICRKLIVTFTKDASNELRARISSSLAKALELDSENQHLAEQIVRLGSADICTIDSFCLKIVRANFERLDLDGGFRIADESETEVLCREAMSEIIDTLYEQRGDDEEFLLVSDCFSGFSNEQRLKDDLLSLYKKLITTKNGINTLLDNINLDTDFLDTAYGRVLREHTILICQHYIKFFEYALDKIRGDSEGEKAFLLALSSDLDFARRLSNIAGDKNYAYIGEVISTYTPAPLGKTTNVTCVDVALFKKTRDEFKKAIRTELNGYFSLSEEAIKSSFEENAKMCRALHSVLDAFDKEYQRKKKTASVCDFNDLSRYAMRLLYDENGHVSSLARDIASKYDEVYVDEYQDTNLVQDSIFYAVSSNNRFLVGDIKQSIYGFRSAEPEIFSKYRTTFEPLDVSENAKNPTLDELKSKKGFTGARIAMSENFRCDKSVIDFSNAVSSYMLEASRGIPYDKSDELKFAKIGCDYESDKAEVYVIDKAIDDENEDEILSNEAEFVANKIQELLDEGYLANGEKIEPRHITILLRGYKRPVELYTLALQKRGIPCEYKGDERFFEKSEILLALCILNAIDNPLRDVYLAGAMRSDVFGFSLEEMAKIRKSTPSADSFYSAVKLYDTDDELGERVRAFIERLQYYRNESRKKSSAEMLSCIYAETNIISSASASQRRNLLKLYDIARSYERGKYKGLYGFLRYVESIKEGSVKEELGSDEENSVRLMSVHASKGLEFEVCFVSACGAKMTNQDASEPMLFHRGLGVNAYVSRPNGLIKFNTILRKCTQLAIKKSSAEEEMRMLYVAMTRARSKLIITGATKDPDAFIRECEMVREFKSEYSILHPKCYLSWILGATYGTDVAKIEAIYPNSEGACEPIMADSEAQSEEQIEIEATKEEGDEVLALARVLDERFNFEYGFKHLERLPSKLTVSRLTPTVLDEEQNDDDDTFELDDLPSFIKGDKKSASATDRGTATHIFMQFCSFDLLEKAGVKAELDRLVDEAYISKENSELVNLSHIELFLKSDLFGAIRSAKKLLREFRFNVMIPASEVSEDERLNDYEVLVQGVCDCIIEKENGEIILVDYKTDKVNEQNYKSILKERYTSQLTYYRRALELMLEKPVSKTVIYSVPLGKSLDL